MKVTDHIKNANGKTLFSFEVIPPKKGKNIQDLYNNIDPLMEFKPPFIDVTTSREEYVYIDRGNGLLDKRITRMRPGTVVFVRLLCINIMWMQYPIYYVVVLPKRKRNMCW